MAAPVERQQENATIHVERQQGDGRSRRFQAQFSVRVSVFRWLIKSPARSGPTGYRCRSGHRRLEIERRTFLASLAAAAITPTVSKHRIRRSRSSTPTSTCSIRPARKGHPIVVPRTQDRRCRRFRRAIGALAGPLGVVGAIKVEASPWIEDNLWVLQVAQQDPIIVGVIGNLEPEKPEFAEYLGATQESALPRHPLREPVGPRLHGAGRNAGVHRRAEAPGRRRSRDGHGQSPLSLLQAIVRVTDKVPTLRVVLDHLPRSHPETAADRAALDAVLRELGARPQMYVKLSAIIHSVQRVRSRPSSQPYRDAARPADGGLRRGSRDLRQRLAEQRRRCADRQGRSRSRRSTSRPSRGCGREVFLEELDRGVQMGQARPVSAESLKARILVSRGNIAMRTLCSFVSVATVVVLASIGVAGEQGAKPAKGVALFDGKTFNGWEGDLKIFRIEDGAIVAGTLDNKIARNEFLCTTQTYGDFELRLKVKLLGGDNANAGMQFRTKRIPNHHEVIGLSGRHGRRLVGCALRRIAAEQGAHRTRPGEDEGRHQGRRVERLRDPRRRQTHPALDQRRFRPWTTPRRIRRSRRPA